MKKTEFREIIQRGDAKTVSELAQVHKALKVLRSVR